VTKRAFDLLFATIGLTVLSPVLAAIAVWVRFDSPGPSLFRQERIGRYGRPFKVLKFRTMRAGQSSPTGLLRVGNDRRVTPAGRFLRRWKLDELPQLVNVVKGEMSLVGPRPEVARYVDLYPADVRAIILSVRPGITDYAAIAFRDESSLMPDAEEAEAIYVTTILPRKLALYQRYVADQSLATDLKIILSTLTAIVRRG
jgi:lipopolysaccharide/colanic/teichoic acid biosynthesis glycosyltransferase